MKNCRWFRAKKILSLTLIVSIAFANTVGGRSEQLIPVSTWIKRHETRPKPLLNTAEVRNELRQRVESNLSGSNVRSLQLALHNSTPDANTNNFKNPPTGTLSHLLDKDLDNLNGAFSGDRFVFEWTGAFTIFEALLGTLERYDPQWAQDTREMLNLPGILKCFQNVRAKPDPGAMEELLGKIQTSFSKKIKLPSSKRKPAEAIMKSEEFKKLLFYQTMIQLRARSLMTSRAPEVSEFKLVPFLQNCVQWFHERKRLGTITVSGNKEIVIAADKAQIFRTVLILLEHGIQTSDLPNATAVLSVARNQQNRRLSLVLGVDFINPPPEMQLLRTKHKLEGMFPEIPLKIFLSNSAAEKQKIVISLPISPDNETTRSELRNIADHSRTKMRLRNKVKIALAVACLIGAAGCIAKTDIHKLKTWAPTPPPERIWKSENSAAAPAKFRLNPKDLPELIALHNFGVRDADFERIIKEIDAVRAFSPEFKLGLQIAFDENGVPTVKGRLGTEIPQIGNFEISGGMAGERLFLTSNIAYAIYSHLSGRYDLAKELAAITTRIAAAQLEQKTNEGYEEAFELLARIYVLQEEIRMIRSTIFPSLQNAQGAARERARLGLLSDPEKVTDIANAETKWQRKIIEAESKIHTQTTRLLTLISSNQEDLFLEIEAVPIFFDEHLKQMLPDFEREMHRMIDSQDPGKFDRQFAQKIATALQYRATKIDPIPDPRPSNLQLRTALLRWQAMQLEAAKKRLDQLDVGLAFSFITWDGENHNANDVGSESKAKRFDQIIGTGINLIQNQKNIPSGITNTATNLENVRFARDIVQNLLGKREQKKSTAINPLVAIPNDQAAQIAAGANFELRFGPKVEMEKRMASLTAERARAAVERVKHDTEAEIKMMVDAILSTSLLVENLKIDIERTRAFLTRARGKSKNGRRLIYSEDQLFGIEEKAVELEIEILNLKADRAIWLERLVTVGAIEPPGKSRSELRGFVKQLSQKLRKMLPIIVLLIGLFTFAETARGNELTADISKQPMLLHNTSYSPGQEAPFPFVNVNEIKKINWARDFGVGPIVGAIVELKNGRQLIYGPTLESKNDLPLFAKELGLNTGRVVKRDLWGRSIEIAVQTPEGEKILDYKTVVDEAHTLQGRIGMEEKHRARKKRFEISEIASVRWSRGSRAVFDPLRVFNMGENYPVVGAILTLKNGCEIMYGGSHGNDLAFFAEDLGLEVVQILEKEKIGTGGIAPARVIVIEANLPNHEHKTVGYQEAFQLAQNNTANEGPVVTNIRTLEDNFEQSPPQTNAAKPEATLPPTPITTRSNVDESISNFKPDLTEDIKTQNVSGDNKAVSEEIKIVAPFAEIPEEVDRQTGIIRENQESLREPALHANKIQNKNQGNEKKNEKELYYEQQGQTTPIPFGNTFPGEMLNAKTSGKIEFLIPENVRDVKKGEGILRVVDQELGAAISSLETRAKIIQASLNELVLSSSATERELLRFDQSLNEVMRELQSLRHQREILGNYQAPFDLQILSRRHGNVSPGEPLFEFIPKNRVRLTLTVPSHIIDFNDVRISIDKMQGTVINIARGELDPKHLTTPLTIDVMLEQPLENPNSNHDYQLKFYCNEIPGAISPLAGENYATVRVVAREKFDLIAPQSAGRLHYINAAETSWVNKGDVVALISGGDFYQSEIESETAFLEKIQEFLEAIAPEKNGWPNIPPAEANALKMEIAKLAPIRASQESLQVYAPQSGILIHSYDQEGQPVRPGEKIGSIITPRVAIGSFDDLDGNSAILLEKSVDIHTGNPVIVQLPINKVLIGKVTAVQSNLESKSFDLSTMKAIRVEVEDPAYQLQPGMIVQLASAGHNQSNQKSQVTSAAKPSLIPATWAPSRLPILAELALSQAAEENDEKLVENIINERNPIHRIDAFHYFAKHFRSHRFIEQLETMAFEGGSDIAQESLRLLRDENEIVALVNIYDRAMRQSGVNSLQARYAYDYLVELIEQNDKREGSNLLYRLREATRNHPPLNMATRNLMVRILASEHPDSPALLNILRTHLNNEDLLSYYLTFTRSPVIGDPTNEKLAALVKTEIVRRIALQKLDNERFGFLFDQLLAQNSYSTTFWIGAADRLNFLNINREQDIRFLTSSAYWQTGIRRIDPHIASAALSDFEHVLTWAQKHLKPYGGITISNTRENFENRDAMFQQLGLPLQNDWIARFSALPQYYDMVRLLKNPSLQNEQKIFILHQLKQTPEGRLHLARCFADTTDQSLAMLASSELENVLGDLIHDIVGAAETLYASTASSNYPAPFVARVYESALIRLYRFSGSTITKDSIVKTLVSSLISSDFELGGLIKEKEDSNKRLTNLRSTIPQDVLENAFAWESERRAAANALERAKERFGLSAGGIIPGFEGTVFNLLEEKRNVILGDSPRFHTAHQQKTPFLSFLNETLHDPKIKDSSKQIIAVVRDLTQKRMDDIAEERRELMPEQSFQVHFQALRSFLAKWKYALIAGFACFLLLVKISRNGILKKNNHFNLLRSLRPTQIKNEIERQKNEIQQIGESEFQTEAFLLRQWVSILSKTEALTLYDVREMHHTAIKIISSKKAMISTKTLKRDLGGIKSVNKIYTSLAEISGLVIRKTLYDAKQNRLLNEYQRLQLYLDLMEFVKIATYALQARKSLSALAVCKLLEGYRIPKINASDMPAHRRIYRKLFNASARFFYRIVRLVFLIAIADRLSTRAFEKRFKETARKGNEAIPNLYTDKHVWGVTDEFHNQREKLRKLRVTPDDFFDLEERWINRRLITRLITLIALMSGAGLTGYCFAGIISSLYDFDPSLFNVHLNWISISIAFAVPVFTLYLHWRPIVRVLSERFSKHHEWQLGKFKKIARARILNANEKTLLQNHENQNRKTFTLQIEQTLNALDNELKKNESGEYANPPSAHAVLVVYSHGENRDKHDYLTAILSRSTRRDIPVIPYATPSDMLGSGIAALAARQYFLEHYEELRRHHPLLPLQPRDAKIFIGLAGKSSTDILPLVYGSDAAIPIGIERNGRAMTTIEYALANFYRMAQTENAEENQKGEKGISFPSGFEMIVPADGIYVGPPMTFFKRRKGIVLIGARMNFDDIDEQGLGVYFTHYLSGSLIQRFFEGAQKSKLKALIEKYSNTKFQIDEKNDKMPQLKAFTGIAVFNPRTNEQYDALNKYLAERFKTIREIKDEYQRKFPDTALPPVDFVRDVVIPMLLSSQGNAELKDMAAINIRNDGQKNIATSSIENLRRWLEVRTSDRTDLLDPTIDFYAKLFDFYEKNKNPVPFFSFTPNHHEAHFADIRKISVFLKEMQWLRTHLGNPGANLSSPRLFKPQNIHPDVLSRIPKDIILTQVPIRLRENELKWVTFFYGSNGRLGTANTVPEFPFTADRGEGIAKALSSIENPEGSQNENGRISLDRFLRLYDKIDYAQLSKMLLGESETPSRSELRYKNTDKMLFALPDTNPQRRLPRQNPAALLETMTATSVPEIGIQQIERAMKKFIPKLPTSDENQGMIVRRFLQRNRILLDATTVQHARGTIGIILSRGLVYDDSFILILRQLANALGKRFPVFVVLGDGIDASTIQIINAGLADAEKIHTANTYREAAVKLRTVYNAETRLIASRREKLREDYFVRSGISKNNIVFVSPGIMQELMQALIENADAATQEYQAARFFAYAA